MKESVHPHIDRFDITYDFVHETGTFTHQTEEKMVFVREIGLLAHGTHRILILSTAACRGIRRHR